ncbi:MAG: BRO family protein [Thauera sp.]|jgi:prophage antirepressor-like protein|nr:BRO family protein [Thauera sp.]
MAQSATGALAPTIFNFRSTAVRTTILDGVAWFVASDVAKALNYRNANDMTRMLDEDERGTHIVRIVSTNQHGATSEQDNKVIIINESGLYHAVLRSRKPEARPFRKWVTAEVLPAIRKTGQYNTDKTAAPEQRVLDVEAISAANALSASYAATIQADLFNRLLQHGGRLDDFSARYLMSFGGYAPPPGLSPLSATPACSPGVKRRASFATRHRC